MSPSRGGRFGSVALFVFLALATGCRSTTVTPAADAGPDPAEPDPGRFAPREPPIWPWPHLEETLRSQEGSGGVGCPAVHDAGTALFTLANPHQGRGGHEYVFDITVHADRCIYFFDRGSFGPPGGGLRSAGRVEPEIVERLARDASALRFFELPEDLRVDSRPGVQLTIRGPEGPHSVRYDEVRWALHVEELRARRPEAVEPSLVAHLLGQRLWDLALRDEAWIGVRRRD